MRPLNALRGISRLFTKRPEAIAPAGRACPATGLAVAARLRAAPARVGARLHSVGGPQPVAPAPAHPVVRRLHDVDRRHGRPRPGSHRVLPVRRAIRRANSARKFAVMFSRPACSSPSRYILFQNITSLPILQDGALSTTKAYTDVHDEWAKEVQRASAGEDRPWVKAGRRGATRVGRARRSTASGSRHLLGHPPRPVPGGHRPVDVGRRKDERKSLLQIAEGSAAAAAAAAAAVPRPPPRARAAEQRRLRARRAGWRRSPCCRWRRRTMRRRRRRRQRRRRRRAGGADAGDAARPRRDPTTRSRCGPRRRGGIASK